MMAKAKFFKDEKILQHMKLENVPKKIKALGRKVANFNEEEWKKVSKTYMTEGLMLKFSQNEELKQFLLNTQDQIIAEASPFDKLWGIGVDEATAIKNKH